MRALSSFILVMSWMIVILSAIFAVVEMYLPIRSAVSCWVTVSNICRQQCFNNAKLRRSPTFVVTNVPLDVHHHCGLNLTLEGMYSLLSGCMNNRLPSDPLSNRTFQTILEFSALFDLNFGIAHTVVCNPLPLTTSLIHL